MTTWVVFHIIGAYLLGSISSAVLITRIFVRADIREQGSGNPGTTNVLRVAGKKAAAAVFVFDVLKGAIPVYAGFLLGYEPIILSIIAVSACIGHMYPIFFSFKGGKAVATALGAMMPLNGWLALCLLGTWIVIFAITRISSLAAIATLLLAPLYAYLFKPEYTLAVAILCGLIIVKHKSNIGRLLNKQENKIKKPAGKK
ncbi:MAG: glycerol-3-phosphate acyltransferase PlsY [Alphaproteobacteria bacterium]|jgi:glycerol-3-phosphate acyltransferase PlsY